MNPNYKILFEPIKIGPVTSKNRFYQVPHCTGMGWQRPNMLAAAVYEGRKFAMEFDDDLSEIYLSKRDANLNIEQ